MWLNSVEQTLEQKDNNPSSMPSITEPFYLGYDVPSGSRGVGRFDEFALFENQVLDQDQIDAIYNNSRIILDNLSSAIEYKQEFQVNTQVKVGRIGLQNTFISTEPHLKLICTVTDQFENELTKGFIYGFESSDSEGNYDEVIITLDDSITFYPDSTYKIILKTNEILHPWWLQYVSDLDTVVNLKECSLYVDNVLQADKHLLMNWYRDGARDEVLTDYYTAKQVSEYKESGSYTSKKVNIGVLPDSYYNINWGLVSADDDVSVRIKAASTEAALDTTNWSSWFTDNNGLNDISHLSGQWFQFQIKWENGTSSSSDIVKEVSVLYNITGAGQAIVISKDVEVEETPDSFIFRFQDTGGQFITYEVSRDGGLTYQVVDRADEGDYIEFTADPGTTLKVKTTIQSGGRLYGYALATNEEII